MSRQVIVYILRCSDGSYYVGSTLDISDRIDRHNTGEGSAWTRLRRPVKVVYQEIWPSLLLARRREQQIKGWKREKKEKLISGIWGKSS